eukprot:scaffold34619_cov183-Amphora_coffeaeformis.AAC.11
MPSKSAMAQSFLALLLLLLLFVTFSSIVLDKGKKGHDGRNILQWDIVCTFGTNKQTNKACILINRMLSFPVGSGRRTTGMREVVPKHTAHTLVFFVLLRPRGGYDWLESGRWRSSQTATPTHGSRTNKSSAISSMQRNAVRGPSKGETHSASSTAELGAQPSSSTNFFIYTSTVC